MFWFGERRPQRCMDWWEGMIYVAPVSQLSSGLLSLITAIRLPLHCSSCLRQAITASLLSHTHKGKGRIRSPHFPVQKVLLKTKLEFIQSNSSNVMACSWRQEVIIFLLAMLAKKLMDQWADFNETLKKLSLDVLLQQMNFWRQLNFKWPQQPLIYKSTKMAITQLLSQMLS